MAKINENVFISSSLPDSLNTIRLNKILENTLRNLFSALAENPKISNLNYVEPLSKSLPGMLTLTTSYRV